MTLLLPRVPGRLPWGVTRGLTNRIPLDDASIDNVVHDIVGNTYLIKDSVAPIAVQGPPLLSSFRGLQFGKDATGADNTNNELNWLTSPIPDLWSGSLFYWVWIDQYGAVSDGNDPRHIDIGTPHQINVYSESSSGNLGVQIDNGFSTVEVSTSTINLDLGKWYHVGFTWDLTTITLFVNGQRELAPGTGSGPSAARSGVYSVGGRGLSVGGGGGADRTFGGRMADIRFYTGTLLTDAEVAQLYFSAFQTEEIMPALFLAAGGGSFIPAWARNSNLPVIGTGTY